MLAPASAGSHLRVHDRMSRRDRAGGSGLSRGVPREGPRGRDRAGGTAGAPEERADLIDRPGALDDDTTVTTRARDLDRLVAELRDLEAYNQRQERALRRAQRAVDRDAERERRSQLDGTAVALERSSDGFFGSTGGGRSGDHHRALDHEFTAASSRGGSRQRARDSRHARRRGVPASMHRHLRRESTDFVPSDDLDDPIQIHDPSSAATTTTTTSIRGPTKGRIRSSSPTRSPTRVFGGARWSATRWRMRLAN